MKNYLLPQSFKIVGWILFIAGLVLGILWYADVNIEFLDRRVFSLIDTPLIKETKYFKVVENNIIDELAGVFIIVGALFTCFAKLKDEDEYSSKIRLESLVWATHLNYILIVLSIIFVYDLEFFHVMVFNMVTILLFFMLRFHLLIRRTRKSISHEE